MTYRSTSLCLFLTACATDLASGTDRADLPTDTATPARPTPTFRIEVEPSSDASFGRPVLPAVFGPFLAADGLTLELRPAVRLDGHLVGARTLPWGTTGLLPTTTVDVPATVRLVATTLGVESVVEADATGLYQVDVVPDLYQFLVVPHDPMFAPSTVPLPLTRDRRYDLTVADGLPVWGRAIDGSGIGIVGAQVRASNTQGLQTSAATTDGNGWYELHVGEGTWTLTGTPPSGRRLPKRFVGPVEIADAGGRVDLSWPALTRATVTAHLTDLSGGPLARADVTLTSVSLDDYNLGGALYTITAPTDIQGFLETTMPAGVYRLALEPGPDAEWAPYKLGDLRVLDETDLGTLVVEGFVDSLWTATDTKGVALGGAVTTCAELDGTHRRWSFDADEDGVIAVNLPRTPLDCLVSAPGARADLAPTRMTVEDPTVAAEFVLGVGDPVGGRVVVTDGTRTVASSYSVVRVIAEDGTVIAQGATDGEGTFRLRVPPAE